MKTVGINQISLKPTLVNTVCRILAWLCDQYSILVVYVLADIKRGGPRPRQIDVTRHMTDRICRRGRSSHLFPLSERGRSKTCVYEFEWWKHELASLLQRPSASLAVLLQHWFSRQWSLEFLLLCSQRFFWLNSFIRTLRTTGKRLAELRTTLPCVQRCESNEHTSHTSLMEASHHRRWILFTAWKSCGSLYDADNTATCSQTNLQLRFCFSCTCCSIYFSTRRGWAVVFE